MRVRTIGLSALALGILIGAGGCSSESPTSPLTPATVSAAPNGVPAGSLPQDTTTTTTTDGGAYAGSGGRTVTTTGGAYAGSGG